MKEAAAGREVPLLEVRDLSVAFAGEAGTVEVTDRVSFSVDAGQTLALVGESGCGKSVTAGAIMQLLPHPAGRITSGAVRLRGRELLGLPPQEMYRLRGSEMAMVFQEPMTSLNPVHTALDQIVEVLKLHRPDVPRRQRPAEAVKLLAEVEIPDAGRRSASYPFQLSGGMRQRVMIAMALAGRPRLLIADEPTTALDVTVQSQILTLLRRLRADHAMGMLYITHDTAVVEEIADRVVVMYAGQVVEEGTVGEVFDAPLHPYTRGLMECAPRLDSTPRTRLASIPGTVPPAQRFPSHCRFADRCPLVGEECRAAPIPLRRIGGRQVRCIKARAGKPGRAASEASFQRGERGQGWPGASPKAGKPEGERGQGWPGASPKAGKPGHAASEASFQRGERGQGWPGASPKAGKPEGERGQGWPGASPRA